MKNKTLQLVVLLAVLFLLTGGFAGVLAHGIARASANTRALDDEQAFEETRKTHLQSLEGLVRDTASARESLAARFVSEEEVTRLLDDIERAAVAAGASQEIVTVAVVGEAMKRLQVRVQVSGSWTQVTRDIALIESLPWALRFENIVLATDTDESWSGTLLIETAMR